MPHIPKAACVPCGVPFQVERQGRTVEMIAAWGSYYKIMGDLLKCPSCGQEILTAFGMDPISEHFEPEYSKVKADHSVAIDWGMERCRW